MSFGNYSAAHDLMSRPPLHNKIPSSTQLSVQIPKPTPATVKIYPENALFAEFYSKQLGNPSYPRKTNTKHQDMPKNSEGQCSIVFSPKNNRTVSKISSKLLKNLGKMIPQLKR